MNKREAIIMLENRIEVLSRNIMELERELNNYNLKDKEKEAFKSFFSVSSFYQICKKCLMLKLVRNNLECKLDNTRNYSKEGEFSQEIIQMEIPRVLLFTEDDIDNELEIINEAIKEEAKEIDRKQKKIDEILHKGVSLSSAEIKIWTSGLIEELKIQEAHYVLLRFIEANKNYFSSTETC